MKRTVYLGLGSNLGDRAANLSAAIAAMPASIQILHSSPIYESAPWGFEKQGDFLNQVVEAQTDLSPEKLLDHLKQIEARVGRTATFRNGPREIDIDILFYDDILLETAELTIPHPRVSERAFMLVPLADIDAGLIHPVLGQTISQLLSNLDTAGISLFKVVEN